MSGMTSIVKTMARFVGSIILLFGIYIALHSHLSPGDGFAGGVIVASAVILLTLTEGKETALQKINQNTAILLFSLGALIALGVALLGMFGKNFLQNILPKGTPFAFLSGGTIPLLNLGIALEVAFIIFVTFIVLVSFRIPEDLRRK